MCTYKYYDIDNWYNELTSTHNEAFLFILEHEILSINLNIINKY
jgi:hypothetical protein